MKAKVKTAFPGRPDDASQTREIAVDEEISGDLARVAVENDWAQPLDGEAKAVAAEKKKQDAK